MSFSLVEYEDEEAENVKDEASVVPSAKPDTKGGGVRRTVSLVDYDHGEDEPIEEDEPNEIQPEDNNKITNGNTSHHASPTPTHPESVIVISDIKETVQERPARIVPQRIFDHPLLPPKPITPVDDELKKKIQNYNQLRKRGKFFNENFRKAKDFLNPDILERLVAHSNITEYGTQYPKELFDPESYDDDEFYDRLADRQSLYYEKKPKRSTIEFTSPTEKTKPIIQVIEAKKGHILTTTSVGAPTSTTTSTAKAAPPKAIAKTAKSNANSNVITAAPQITVISAKPSKPGAKTKKRLKK
eukprot:TRINITY_DN5486_c0_g1_i2.p1 TRINITY_DN5486_c0_g1~~TRINITY_DN5486_c0_g1_i2.p1  ORF type:complete len:300 (-),score=86.98 TRINITY_DN5486_c0_g1_i2:33-932(-)